MLNLVAWFLVIAGWVVAHSLTVRREHIKFRREALAKEVLELITNVGSILDLALQYHCNDRDTIKERQLVSQLDRLLMRIGYLPCDDEISQLSATDVIIEFKQSITVDHFEDGHTGGLTAADDQIAFMQHAAYACEHSLMQLRSPVFVQQRDVVLDSARNGYGFAQVYLIRASHHLKQFRQRSSK